MFPSCFMARVPLEEMNREMPVGVALAMEWLASSGPVKSRKPSLTRSLYIMTR